MAKNYKNQTSLKFLGVLFQADLKWVSNIKYIVITITIYSNIKYIIVILTLLYSIRYLIKETAYQAVITAYYANNHSLILYKPGKHQLGQKRSLLYTKRSFVFYVGLTTRKTVGIYLKLLVFIRKPI